MYPTLLIKTGGSEKKIWQHGKGKARVSKRILSRSLRKVHKPIATLSMRLYKYLPYNSLFSFMRRNMKEFNELEIKREKCFTSILCKMLPGILL